MTITRFDSRERLARLRLIRSENVGPVTFRHLLARFGSGARALDALPDLARRGGRTGSITICTAAQAEAELKAAAKTGAEVIFHGEAGYPEALAVIEDAPPLLYLKGHGHLLRKPMIAIVGARNASTVGRKIAATIAGDLGRAGYVIVSGLARGIDGVVHAAALDGGTVAVQAGGVDVIYPREHEALYDEIAACGLILSEMPPGTEPQARHFPRRNRIISGLSRGVLVIEASLKSGSLITARCALDQGREVFAVPGSPLDPRAKGTNQLIRNGALLTEAADDIVQALAQFDDRRVREPDLFGYLTPPPVAVPEDQVERARETVLELLSPAPAQIDDLIRQSGLPPAAIHGALLTLELAGRVERHPGNRVSAAPEG